VVVLGSWVAVAKISVWVSLDFFFFFWYGGGGLFAAGGR
jgi:hypothetical protein